MVYNVRVKVEGARELRASLKRAGVGVQDLKDAHLQVAQFVGATAATRAPRRSGLLAASWRPGAAASQATVRFGGAGIPYANPIHWGAGARPGRRGPHNIKPSLFATSAAADTEPVWVPIYFAAIEAVIATIRGA